MLQSHLWLSGHGHLLLAVQVLCAGNDALSLLTDSLHGLINTCLTRRDPHVQHVKVVTVCVARVCRTRIQAEHILLQLSNQG